MKVCQICAVDFTLKNFLLPLIDGMQDQGWQVTAVCSDGPFIPDLRARGYRIIPVPIARSMNPLLAARSVLALVRLFRRERFDIVHAHTPVAALIARLAARIAGVPLVIYTAHGFYFHEEMPGWKYRLFVGLERFGGLFTDLLFSQSSEDAEDAVRLGILRQDRVLAIGNGVDVRRFDPQQVGDGADIRVELGIPAEAVVIGCIGRQVREKGIGEFLQAAQALAARCPQAWFLLVGEKLASDHAQGVEAELAAARAALGPRLVTPGLRGDIPQCLAAMDVFCLPSWREGMPRTIIEAMMMAKPVIATNIRGAREEVVPEETGLLVPLKDPAALAAAMQRLIGDAQARRRFGLAGRERALRLYDERAVVTLQINRIKQGLGQGG
ncbi:glycosyltransferase family 4 protein [Novispirillum itersonii]|uniref:Glycosyltransferase involved in cell wall biosynthesis n=1 Tax=Novispirillum itersonii TaxID=189 RepID=A0A7X0DKJ3_NOVIT|nr:glycosyltransferase family 4 protein [Novispirillum itersonii]MBB6209010.1 glycosyltransferase involved in cell wall biosynthesis [Novispirillum itersonii]